MKKGLRKRILALFMTFVMAVGMSVPYVNADDTYTGGYGIDDVLSQFQFFIQEDATLNTSGHTVGSIAVGDELAMDNYFGDMAIVPSYIYHFVKGGKGNGYNGSVQTTKDIYYGIIDSGANTNEGNWIKNADYMKMTEAFATLNSQSQALRSDSKTVTPSDGTITIDLTKETASIVKYEISASDFNNSNIDIKVSDATWFSEHICVISVSGSGDIKYDGYSKVRINGTSADTFFLNGLEGYEYNGQACLGGMNLIWNFPDTTGEIDAVGVGGHLVAPNAHVYIGNGNYEGGIIAKSMECNAQGHFYPMSKSLNFEDSDITAVLTFEKETEDGTALKGAEMKLEYKGSKDLTAVKSIEGPSVVKASNTVITWKTTDKNLILSGLPEGEYTLTETKAPAGYKLADAVTFKVVDGKAYKKTGSTYSTVAVSAILIVDEAKSGTVALKGTKTVTGENAPNGTYTFNVKDTSGNIVSTGTAKLDGAGTTDITFDKALTYTASDVGKTYSYTVTEVKGNDSNMTYDHRTFIVKVAVSDDGEGDELDLAVTYVYDSANEKVEFTNTYTAPVTTVDITFAKTDSSNNALSGADMKLTYAGTESLAGVTGATVSGNTITWTSGDSAVTLKNLPAGTYTLSEVTAPEGYQYAANVTIVVASDGKITVTKPGNTSEIYDGTTETPTVTVIDEEKTGSITFDGVKYIEGTLETDEAFEFIIKDEKGEVVSTATRTGAGYFEFETIYYTKDDIGTHNYIISEKAGSNGNIVYDSTPYAVAVKVSDDGSNTENLKVEVSSGSKSVEFTNKCVSDEVTGEAPTLDVIFNKVDESDKSLAGATMKLTYVEGYYKEVYYNNNLESVETKDVPLEIDQYDMRNATWVTDGDSITLNSLPEGHYILTEVSAPEGYEIADAIEFRIIADSNGDAQLLYMNGTAYGSNEIKVVDEKKPDKTGAITLTGTKSLIGNNAPEETYTFVLKDSTGTVIDTKTVTGTGSFTFKELAFSEEGTYKYTVSELAGNNEDMIYDSTVKNVIIVVSDTGETELDVQIDKTKSDDIAFTNTYLEPGNLEITIYDTITGEEVPGATVEITYPDGKTVEAVTGTTGDDIGKITINNTDVGEYTIEVTEIPDGYTIVSGEGDLFTAEVFAGETTKKFVYISIEEVVIVEPGNLDIKVIETVEDTGVENAIVKVTYPDGTTKEITTDAYGDISLKELEPGEYKIDVVKVTNGYTVTYGDGKTVDVVSGETAEHEIKITPNPTNPELGNLIITVYDEKTMEIIPGAVVEITTSNGAIKTGVTDENGQILILDTLPGEYIIETTQVPEGYTVTLGGIETAVVVANDTTKHDVYLDNDSLPDNPEVGLGNLIVTVYDEKTKETVAGATVEITNPDGVCVEYVTDSKGKIYLLETAVGAYTIETTKVPEGYTVTLGQSEVSSVLEGLTTTHDIFIDINKTTSVVTNDTGNLIVTVYDEETKAVVMGATVEITYPDGTVKEYITDANGQVVLNNTLIGGYTIETTKVPAGYTVTLGKTETTKVELGKTTTHDVYIATVAETHVNTGDGFNLLLISVIMSVAAIGVLFSIKYKNKLN